MLSYLSHFLSGEVDPFWPHIVLLSVTVSASVAVGAGIIFEGPKYSEPIHQLAMWLVIAGVVVEAACTIFLFVFDEGISGSQQAKIIALETKLAPRSLSDPEATEIEDGLKNFAGQEFTIASYGGEPLSFAQRLRILLDKAGWKFFVPDNEILLLPGSVGIEIDIQSDAPLALSAAEALKAALAGRAIEASTFRQSKDKASTAKIEILVGSKF